MPNQFETAFDQLTAHFRETALLSSIEGLLGWDERTGLPPEAGAYRAEQITLLSGMIHSRVSDPRVGQWLDQLADSPLAEDPHSDAGATIRCLRRRYERKTKLSKQLVEQLARTSVLGQQAWVEARKQSDFGILQPLLERTIALKREEAAAIGYEEHPYDALLDDYEPDERTENVARVLGALRDELVPLVEAIKQSDVEAPVKIVCRRYPIEAQRSFSEEVARQIGFQFERGRLDVTEHPFCGGAGPNDTRITTRYDARLFNSAFFSVLHEAGHGIYEQGLRTEWFGLPPGNSVSLGIHESQSRLWENQVGRSRSFWERFFPDAQRAFPDALADASLDAFYFAVNDVRPSLIRVEADEATYNLHILIRFELEQALLNDELSVADLPAAWNEKYRDYLGVTPSSDTEGMLQDIHWPAGLVGYFPTYSLGNLYSAQFYEAADQALGGLDEQLRRGEFQPLREWLRANIHTHGQCYRAGDLVLRATGRPLSHDALMRYLRVKLGPLYGLG